MGQIKLLISFTLIALFCIAFITFAVNFSNDNNTAISIGDNGDYPIIKNNLSNQINTFSSDANTSSDAIYKTTISSTTEATEGGTGIKVGPATALSFVRTVTYSAFTSIFGTGSEFNVLIIAFFSLLTFISGLYIYKTLAGRNPD